MKEIIRIHIAKIPYDIEVGAKHEIERYFKELESYAKDDEIMRDIEIRISEILAERGIVANGVIANDDIAAIKNQLGKPSDFKSDDDSNEPKTQKVFEKRKLYRDTDNAILGGVLSGLANYFNVDVIVTRLIFVLLFLFSGGSFVMMYILFWIIMPPAKTATEKIRMTGQEVNLESIKKYSESEADVETRKHRAGVARSVLAALFGCMFMLSSIAIAAFTMITGWLIALHGSDAMFNGFNNWSFALVLGLMVMAGLLLALLFAIFAYASFFQKFTRKIGNATIIVIAIGMLAFTSAIGIAIVQSSTKGVDWRLNSFAASDYSDEYSRDKIRDVNFDTNITFGNK